MSAAGFELRSWHVSYSPIQPPQVSCPIGSGVPVASPLKKTCPFDCHTLRVPEGQHRSPAICFAGFGEQRVGGKKG